MDPQSLAFIPSNDVWRLNNTMRNFQEVQQDHADRLSRLERRQDDDARLKSVWGSASPFPGILSGGTPQHGPIPQASVAFADFDDDQSNSMVRSLHLDADDEPRRFGASRANSVRFDESAKQGQWAHTSRSSVDLPRTSSLGAIGGGHTMYERTISHKSDGRQSSAGQSATSGRANSLMMLDSGNLLSSSSTDLPTIAPGLFILGTVPAIIRCWLNANFKHDSLLYAAVCTGSYKSYLDARLVENLGLSGQIRHDLSGARKIRVPIYLPEAILQPASSRSSSPVPQLPSLTVDFNVLDRGSEQLHPKAIQIFIGSDLLRAHSADILFSSNSMTLFDDDRMKLSIPFVRPENEETFKTLITSATAPNIPARPNLFLETKDDNGVFVNGNGLNSQREDHEIPTLNNNAEKEISNGTVDAVDEPQSSTTEPLSFPRVQRRLSPEPATNSGFELKQLADENSTPSATSARTGQNPAVWGSWRREGTGQSEWTGGAKVGGSSFSRSTRDQGMKVLKPTSRQPSRSGTTTAPLPASPTITGQSRFFDDGKRRSNLASNFDSGDVPSQQSKRSISGETFKPQSQLRENSTPLSATSTAPPKTRSANPIGEASAFNWLNSGSNQR